MKKNYRAFSIQPLEDKIFLVEFNSEELKINDVIELFAVFDEVRNGQSVGVMAVSDRYHTAPDATLKYISKMDKEAQRLVFATAIVIDSLPIRLLIMLFMNFHNTSHHRKIFGNKKSALQWLRQKRDDNKKNMTENVKSSLSQLSFL